MAAEGAAAVEGDELLEAGVLAAFTVWPLLKAAVSEQWGGPDSEEKAVWLRGLVIDLLHKKKGDMDDLFDLLDGVMSIEFNALAEDGSVMATAKLISQMYQDVMADNTDKLRGFIAAHGPKDPKPKKARQPADDVQAEIGDALQAAGIADGEEKKEGEEAEEPVQSGPDADGWETVPKKGKGKRGAHS